MSKLGDIKGIKPAHKAKLKKAKVHSITDLRKRTATPNSRFKLQNDSGLPRNLIEELANRADLLRIKGIGSEFSDLLANAGIDNVKKLANNEPNRLLETLAQKNSILGRRNSRLPGQVELKSWVRQAKTLTASEPAGPGGGRPGGRKSSGRKLTR